MERITAIAIAVGLLTAWGVFLYKRSGGRIATPLWVGFGVALVAVLYLVGAGHLTVK
jgi:hypothetical protein